MKEYKKAHDRIMKYFRAHPYYNSMVHVLAGVGLGIAMARPFVDHPVRWGVGLVALSVLGHLYPLISEK